MAFIPTLMVGLGGTGTRIVEQVYNMLGEEDRKNLAVHGFDTDIEDLAKLKSLKGCLTQTSDNITVWQCRQICGEAVDAWFPISANARGLGPLDQKRLTHGAGQIRAVSRLALYYTMKRSGLPKLESDMKSLFMAGGEELRTSARVFIISTLAGGTGAGIFLQVALFIRKYLAQQTGGHTVSIRGLFLLPDIFIQTGVTTLREIPDLRANAYASLKELNGIITSLRGSRHGSVINLEYMPNLEKLDVQAIPYDSCFLLDYENIKGENLGTGGIALQRYQNQAANMVYLQLFSPMGSDNLSHEDNLIRAAIRSDGLNFYCSAGVSRLVYPYQDILKYCAARMVQESLAGQWLHIDRLFAEELSSYDNAIANGELRDKPVLSQFFVMQMESLGGLGSNHPFFTPLYRTTRSSVQEPSSRSKAAPFLDAIRQKIELTLNQNLQFQTHIESLKNMPDDRRLRDRRDVLREVRDTEGYLLALKQYVMSRMITETVNPLLYAILREDAEKPGCLAGREDFRLNMWILAKDEPMHPVAIRYFLYNLEQLLVKEIAVLEELNKGRKALIDTYETTYDLDETEHVVERAQDRVQHALNQKWYKILIGRNQLNNFADEYLDKATEMAKNLVEYAAKKIEQGVFEQLLAGVRDLSGHWERFFMNLQEEQRDLNRSVLLMELEHDKNFDPTCVYVRASAVEKKQLWEHVRIGHRLGMSGTNELWLQLYSSIYNEFAGNHWRQASPFASKASPAMNLIDQLLPWASGQLAENLAVKRNLGQILGENPDSMELIHKVERLAKPWLAKPLNAITEQRYWGVHPDNMKLWLESFITDAFGTDHVINDSSFDPYELLCYQAMYGLTATELIKFQHRSSNGDAGLYFEAYQKERQEYLYNDKSCTHHLDRNWHLPAYLPDLNLDFAKTNEEDRKTAFFYGLVSGMVRCRPLDAGEVWHFYSTSSDSRGVLVQGKPVECGYFNLFEALSYNPRLVDELKEMVEPQREKDLMQYGLDLEKHLFVQGCVQVDSQTILDAILSLSAEKPNLDLEELEWSLVDNCITMVVGYYQDCYGPRRIQTALEDATKFLMQLSDRSTKVSGMDLGSKRHWLKEYNSRIDQVVTKSAQ